MKTAIKVGSIIGGTILISEFFGTLGEGQAFAAMYQAYPEEAQEFIDALEDEKYIGKYGFCKRLKCKMIASVAKSIIRKEEKK